LGARWECDARRILLLLKSYQKGWDYDGGKGDRRETEHGTGAECWERN